MHQYAIGFGWVLPVVFILVMIYFINTLLRSDLSAKDILDRKYANGELDELEYQLKKASLQN